MVPSTVTVLAEECARVSNLIRSLDEDRFALPTRCEPWDIKDLVAPVGGGLFRIPTVLSETVEEQPDTTAVSYWRSFDAVGDAPSIADHARETAREHATGRELAVSFDKLWNECITQVAAESPRRLIKVWWGPIMELEEFLKTRVLETVVHGLDLTDALDHPPVATEAGVLVVTEILQGLLGDALPENVAPYDFILKATGRAELTSADISALGAGARRMPLLG